MPKITLNTLKAMKQTGDKFSCLTAYDSTFANLISSQGIEIILVGDSVGMVCQGNDSTLPVTINDICYHTRNVKKNINNAMLMADMPFASYTTEQQTVQNAAKLMQAGAEIIKLEGEAWLAPMVSCLRQYGIPSCVHMGLMPQSVNVFGGYKVQGRDSKHANTMIQSAITLEQAGASMIVLECVPASLAREITASVSIPVIGIGAGPDTDGQVLVIYDMLDLMPGQKPRFVKNFMEGSTSIKHAISAYRDDVKNGLFPAQEHCF